MPVASSGPSSGLSDDHDHKSDELEEKIGINETLPTVLLDDQESP